MRNIKQLTTAVLAAALALSLTACGSKETTSGNGGGTNTPQSGSGLSGNSSTTPAQGEQSDPVSTPVDEPVKELNIWDVLPEIPVTDESEFKYIFDSDFDGVVINDYIGESTEIRIPDTIDGEQVVRVDFSGLNKEFTQLVTPDSVKQCLLSKQIRESLQYVNVHGSGSKVFNGCTSLTSVYISNSATEIGFMAFNGCTSLTSVYIGNGVTKILASAFGGCTSLTGVTILNSVTLIAAKAFDGCTSLTRITIPDSVTKIYDDAFNGCENIQATYKGKTYDYEHIDDLYAAINGD